jgi:hypothetical protein
VSRKRFDTSVKDMVEAAPEDWLVLAGLPRAPVRLIDADLTAVSRAADKVMLVEDKPPYLFHLEFQSGHDAATLPPKLNVRNALLEDRHDKPVRTVVVLLRPEADSPALSGRYQRGFDGEEPYRVFRYDVMRVWKLDPEALLKGGLGTLPLAPLAAKSKEDVPAILAGVRERIDLSGAAGATSVWETTLPLLELRFSEEEIQMFLRDVLPKSKIFEAIKQEGNKEAAVKLRETLLVLATESLGAPDEETRAKIGKIDDVFRLNDLILRQRLVKSWEELLAEKPASKPAARRAKKRKGS